MNRRILTYRSYPPAAFTLVELVVGMIMATVIILSLSMMLVGPQKVWQRGGVLAEMQREMSLANERVARVLREATWVTVTGEGTSLVFLRGTSSGRIFRDGDRLVIETDDVEDRDIKYLYDLRFTPRAGRITMETKFARGRESIQGELVVDMRNLNLIGNWPLAEGSGSVAFDSSGWSNNAALYNTTWSSITGGGHSLFFDSARPSYLWIPSSDALYTGRRTVYEFRVNLSSGPGKYATLYSRGNVGLSHGYHWIFLYSNNGNIAFQGTDGSSIHMVLSDPMQWVNGRWYDIVIIVDVEYGEISFWRDDVHMGTNAISKGLRSIADGNAHMGVVTGFRSADITTGWNGYMQRIIIGTD